MDSCDRRIQYAPLQPIAGCRQMLVHSSISRSNFTVDDTCDLPQARACDQLQDPSSAHPLAVPPHSPRRHQQSPNARPTEDRVCRSSQPSDRWPKMGRAHDISNSRSDRRLPSAYGAMQTDRRTDGCSTGPMSIRPCCHANRPNERIVTRSIRCHSESR
jgi:hypothetical protein